MSGKARILVIDDEIDICDFSKMVLERTGKFEVTASQDAVQGLHLAKRDAPDLILLDINMPDIDGGQLAQDLREDEATKEIPIIFITGLINKEEGKNTEKIGKNFYMAKPVTPKELIAKVETVINMQKIN
jgi:DNA-binding response OmpR family regulator